MAFVTLTGCDPDDARKPSPVVQKGVLDLRHWDFETHGPVSLDGQWEFYWETFLSPNEMTATDNTVQPRPEMTGFIDVPGYWTDSQDTGVTYPSFGYATYRLTLLLGRSKENLGLNIMTIGTAYDIYAAGQKLSAAGSPGKDRASSRPGFHPVVAGFTPSGTSVELVIHVSNFHHARAGLWDELVLGQQDQLELLKNRKDRLDFFLTGVLFIMGMYHLGIFCLRRKDASALFFCLFCLLIVLRLMSTDDIQLLSILPGLHPMLIYRIEYLSWYLGAPVFTLFLWKVYPELSRQKIIMALVAVGILFSAVPLIAPLHVFTKTKVPCQLFNVVNAVYLIAVLIRAVFMKKPGARVLLFGGVFFFIFFINDILHSDKIIHTGNYVPMAMLVFIFSQAIFLAIRFSKAFTEVETLSANLSNVINNSPAGIFQLSPEGVFLKVNPRMAEIYGYDSPNDFKAHIPDLKQHLSLADSQFFRKKMDAGEVVNHLECRHLTGKGRDVDVSISSVPSLNQKGDIAWFDGVLEDITDRKKSEKRLKKETERANRMAESAKEASRIKSEFLANMSHEIRTPINGVMGMAEILLETDLDDNQEMYLKTIENEADSLLVIINSILDFSKIEAGKMTLETIGFDLGKIFRDLGNVMGIRATAKELDFRSRLDPDVPRALIGDPGRLRQVLVNLADNAIKFTNQGGISIHGTKILEQESRVRIRFEVKDSGVGIPSEKQAGIFQSFSQADSSTTRKFGGTGLGITICKQLVELMGGEIGLESFPGKGSTFWFFVEFDKQVRPRNMITDTPVDLSQKQVLAVGASSAHQQALTEYLTRLNAVVHQAGTADQAFEILEREKAGSTVEVIITDSYVDGTSGFDVAKKIKASSDFRHIPIIFMTAKGNIGDGKICRDIGISAYLTKPFKKEELEITMANVLQPARANGTQAHVLITRHAIEEARSRNVRILVAEDYPTNQQIAVRHLKSAGFEVVLAENGARAVDLFEQQRFDLVMMDIQMPEMDGYEATRRIRGMADSARAGTPIIAMTAHVMEGYREKCLRAGMDDYISKPLKRDGLIAMARKWTNQKSSPAPEDASPRSPTAPENHQNQTDAQLPMDIPKALAEFENDRVFLREVVDEFLSTVEIQLETIQCAVTSNDFQRIQKESHAIKGGAANLTAMALSAAASALEQAGKDQNPDQSRDQIEALNQTLADLTRFIRGSDAL